MSGQVDQVNQEIKNQILNTNSGDAVLFNDREIPLVVSNVERECQEMEIRLRDANGVIHNVIEPADDISAWDVGDQYHLGVIAENPAVVEEIGTEHFDEYNLELTGPRGGEYRIFEQNGKIKYGDRVTQKRGSVDRFEKVDPDQVRNRVRGGKGRGWLKIGRRKCISVEIESGGVFAKTRELPYGYRVEITRRRDDLSDRPPEHEILIEVIEFSLTDGIKAEVIDPEGCSQHLDDRKKATQKRGRVMDPERDRKSEIRNELFRGSSS